MKILKKRRQRQANDERDERQEIRGALDEALQELRDGKLLGERIVLRNLGFLFFLTVLVVSYIYNRNAVEAMYHTRVKLIKEVQEVRYKSLAIATELSKISSRAEVTRRLREAGLDLETSKDPPVVLKK
ncbi:MAG: hypothetical protein LBK12_01770 [Odoribacteraceae bacterium]|jgi:hypothetical protein|nr:hypothetical protein [Odoribacteraceae bacterium]